MEQYNTSAAEKEHPDGRREDWLGDEVEQFIAEGVRKARDLLAVAPASDWQPLPAEHLIPPMRPAFNLLLTGAWVELRADVDVHGDGGQAKVWMEYTGEYGCQAAMEDARRKLLAAGVASDTARLRWDGESLFWRLTKDGIVAQLMASKVSWYPRKLDAPSRGHATLVRVVLRPPAPSATATPAAPPPPRTANHDRDKKAYELARRGKTWKEVQVTINKLAAQRGWDTWESSDAARLAVSRLIERHALKPLPKRKVGRKPR